MNRYFFTFGSNPLFPFDREQFVMVKANTAKEACEKFRAVHPNRPDSPFLNCADVYTEENFMQFCAKYYHGRPAETIE